MGPKTKRNTRPGNQNIDRLRKAAEQGAAWVQFNLGVMRGKDEGMSQDHI